MADLLKVGQDAAGSYALSDSKNNILALTLESYLKTIEDVLNRELVPQTLAINGWRFSDKEMPRLTFGKIEDRDLDDLGKYIQRIAAVGALSKDKSLDAELRKIANLPEPDALRKARRGRTRAAAPPLCMGEGRLLKQP